MPDAPVTLPNPWDTPECDPNRCSACDYSDECPLCASLREGAPVRRPVRVRRF